MTVPSNGSAKKPREKFLSCLAVRLVAVESSDPCINYYQWNRIALKTGLETPDPPEHCTTDKQEIMMFHLFTLTRDHREIISRLFGKPVDLILQNGLRCWGQNGNGGLDKNGFNC